MDKRKIERARKYFKELNKIVNRCPKGFKLVYDNQKIELYLVPEHDYSSENFNHGSSEGAPAILCSVGMSYDPVKSDTDGNMVYVEGSIDKIELEAVSSNASQI